MGKFWESFEWHSGMGIDAFLKPKKAVKSLPNTKLARGRFMLAGDDLLIHKTSKALWRFSDDGKRIVPVFESDTLTEDDLNGE